MARLGLLLVSDHYPKSPKNAPCVDGQLMYSFGTLGLGITSSKVFNCFACDFPQSAGEADLWLVSGPRLEQTYVAPNMSMALRVQELQRPADLQLTRIFGRRIPNAA